MDWHEVLERDDLVGGDLETQEDGHVFRGPILSIELRDDKIFIESEWVAYLRGDGKWEKWQNNGVFVNIGHSHPREISEGRIFFTMPYLGVATIFPKGGSKLDPSKVEGLDQVASS